MKEVRMGFGDRTLERLEHGGKKPIIEAT